MNVACPICSIVVWDNLGLNACWVVRPDGPPGMGGWSTEPPIQTADLVRILSLLRHVMKNHPEFLA